MSDIDERDAKAAVQRCDLGSHLAPELGVKIGERLVHEKNGGVPHHGAAKGDSLALSTGELAWLAMEQMRHIEHGGRLLDLSADDLFHATPARKGAAEQRQPLGEVQAPGP